MFIWRFQWSAHLDVVSCMVLHMKDSTECEMWLSSWSEVIQYDIQFSQKNIKLLWTACRSPFLGKSPYRVFSFNAMVFIVNFQLVMKTIKVIISWAGNVHGGHRRPTPALILQFVQELPWELHALRMSGVLDVFHLFNTYQRCVGSQICFQSFCTYFYCFMHAQAITHL